MNEIMLDYLKKQTHFASIRATNIAITLDAYLKKYDSFDFNQKLVMLHKVEGFVNAIQGLEYDLETIDYELDLHPESEGLKHD